MTILITGIHGFIGSNLSKYYKRRGYTVISPARRTLYSIKILSSYILNHRPDKIIHCAAYGNMAHQKGYKKIIKANAITTKNLLDAAKPFNYASFVYLSSSSVYGKTDKPMSENDKLNPETDYALSKIIGETICKQEYNLGKNVVVIRLFSVYGEGEANFRFIPTIIRNLTQNKSITLMTGKHDWIHIDDVVRGIDYFSDRAKQLKGKPINLGTGTQNKNRYILRYLASLHDDLPNVIKCKKRPQDSRMWVANMKKANKLGFIPRITLEEGLRRCYGYYAPQKNT